MGRARRGPPDRPSPPEHATGGASAIRAGSGLWPWRGEGTRGASWTPASGEGRWRARLNRPWEWCARRVKKKMPRQRGAQVIADKGRRARLFFMWWSWIPERWWTSSAWPCVVFSFLFRWRWCPQQGTLDLGRWLVARR